MGTVLNVYSEHRKRKEVGYNLTSLMNNHIYSTLFKMNHTCRRSKERNHKTHTNKTTMTHVTLNTELQFTAFMLNFLAASMA